MQRRKQTPPSTQMENRDNPLSHLRTMLPESSSRLLPAQQPNHATWSLFHSKTRYLLSSSFDAGLGSYADLVKIGECCIALVISSRLTLFFQQYGAFGVDTTGARSTKIVIDCGHEKAPEMTILVQWAGRTKIGSRPILSSIFPKPL